VEFNLQNASFKATSDYLPDPAIGFEGATDFKGIFYNERHIFGFKRYMKEKENNNTYFLPSICKYESKGASKFKYESWKKIPL